MMDENLIALLVVVALVVVLYIVVSRSERIDK